MINFQNATDDQIKEFLKEQGFIEVRRLEDGEWVGLLRLAFTMSVCCGIDEMCPFKYRWCFADTSEAYLFYTTVKDYDEVPESRESLKGHRYTDKPLLVCRDEFGNPKW